MTCLLCPNKGLQVGVQPYHWRWNSARVLH
jgi:hypothetical protein